ncbi:MAG: hypothetical protein KDI44_18655 [Thiothrix sp.]|nr:hypothetical protein [Thiothrix sp.]HPQ96817.1 hypothetical protein [Thiolinea sp.]
MAMLDSLHIRNFRLCLFQGRHISKARRATLLAGQVKPGLSAGKAYRAGVFPAFHHWLTQLFTTTQT